MRYKCIYTLYIIISVYIDKYTIIHIGKGVYALS